MSAARKALHRAVLIDLRNTALAVALMAISAGIGAAVVLHKVGVRGICQHEYSTGCVWLGPWQGVKGGDIVINPANIDR